MKWIIRILIIMAIIAGAGYLFHKDIFLAVVERAGGLCYRLLYG